MRPRLLAAPERLDDTIEADVIASADNENSVSDDFVPTFVLLVAVIVIFLAGIFSTSPHCSGSFERLTIGGVMILWGC